MQARRELCRERIPPPIRDAPFPEQRERLGQRPRVERPAEPPDLACTRGVSSYPRDRLGLGLFGT